MRQRIVFLFLALLLVAVGARAQRSPNPQREGEPEEPDFAFVSGSAYTQGKNSTQFIHQTAYGTRRFVAPGGRRNEDHLLFFQRVEYGITDRWELDFVLSAVGSRTRLNGHTTSSDSALADGLVGIRYRLLDEEKAPLTLAMGPQVILRTGSVRRGTGKGATGFAWDVAASKDWRGPVFLYTTLNYHVLPLADDTTVGSTREFLLHGASWTTALGFRALERSRGGSKHDIHFFLEGGGAWDRVVEPGVTFGKPRGELLWVFSPGLRYGLLTPRKTLIEIGIATPIGLGPNGPKYGFSIQFQFERYFTPPLTAKR